MMRKILLAFQFLTIIPVKIKGEISEKEIGEASGLFPVVGAFQGVLLVTANFILTKIFPMELVSSLLIVMLVLSNGGLHLDGLADTFDAIASQGDRERKLAIMKDNTTGPVGVIAIVLAFLLKFLALSSLSHFSPLTFYFSLLLMPVFSRWTILLAIFHGKPAREEGLGKLFIENTGMKELVVATLFVIILLLFLHSLFTACLPARQVHYSLSLLPLPVLYIFSFLSVGFFNKRFGGMTGDTLGAVNEVSEILFLMVIICLQKFI